MAGDFDRQVTELQIRIAAIDCYTALGIPRHGRLWDKSVRGKVKLRRHSIYATCVTAPYAIGMFRADPGAPSGADMCPAFDGATYMPRARIMFEGRVLSKKWGVSHLRDIHPRPARSRVSSGTRIWPGGDMKNWPIFILMQLLFGVSRKR